MSGLVSDVLAAWRAAERVAAEQMAGTPDHDAALAAIERLRDLYAMLTHGVATDRSPDAATAAATLAEIRARMPRTNQDRLEPAG